MRGKLIAALLGLMLVLTVAPTVSAAEVGASGQCWNDANDGGEDEASVSTEDGVTLPTITGAVFAVVTFVQGTIEDGNPGSACDFPDCGEEPNGPGAEDEDAACDEDSPDRKDYLEVHVDASDEAGVYVQVCYDGEPHPSSPDDASTQHCPESTPNGPA